jgi:type VI secretion system protein ImpM
MAPSFGAFGKMPALGDFFRLDLPQGFVDAWDIWLQTALVTGRAALGARWNDCFLTAPLWRFSLAPGLAGSQAITGVMMASVDRVGRQFPLTLAAPHPVGASPERVHLAATSLFDDLETIALDMLEDGMTRERLAERLSGLRLPPVSATTPGVAGAPLMIVARDEGALQAELAGDHLSCSYRRPSLWSAVMGDGRRRLLVCEGLPGASLVPTLFESASPVWSDGGPDG